MRRQDEERLEQIRRDAIALGLINDTGPEDPDLVQSDCDRSGLTVAELIEELDELIKSAETA